MWTRTTKFWSSRRHIYDLTKNYVNISTMGPQMVRRTVKQYPGNARQRIVARAETNVTKPSAHHLWPLSTPLLTLERRLCGLNLKACSTQHLCFRCQRSGFAFVSPAVPSLRIGFPPPFLPRRSVTKDAQWRMQNWHRIGSQRARSLLRLGARPAALECLLGEAGGVECPYPPTDLNP